MLGVKVRLWGETFDRIAVILVECVEAEVNIEAKEGMKWMSRNELEGGNWVGADKELGPSPGKTKMRAVKEINGNWRSTATIAKVLDRLKIVPEIVAIIEDDCALMMRNAGNIRDDYGLVDINLLVLTVVCMQKWSLQHLDKLKTGGVKVRDSECLLTNAHCILCDESIHKVVVDSEKNIKTLSDIRHCEEDVRDIFNHI
ncbi:hypothetical protein FGB62_26g26 [Gracilaria domingensis]|nr:hypothetical protein FGB62_26g26 [Gracilaria domingensis]